jgi:hypothetical protein
MTVPRYAHVAALLPDGKVLIAGGADFESSGTTALSSAELFDPATNAFAATGSMSTARYGATATTLADGRVLIAGGNDSPTPTISYATTELYDPHTGTFSPGGTMIRGRSRQTATLLADGRVLITGGIEYVNDTVADLAEAELYDPRTNGFTATGALSTARSYQTATRLADGRVLVAGGGGSDDAHLSAEIYDPARAMFTATGSLTTPRYKDAAVLLPDGRVLFIGGAQDTLALDTAELYDPAKGSFSSTGSMTADRAYPTASLLANGQVLVTGAGPDAPVASAELYDPGSGRFSSTGSMSTVRSLATATVLGNGQVLIAGGGFDAQSGFGFATAELFQ